MKTTTDQDFRPTHRITFTEGTYHAPSAVQTWTVMLADGAAYTEEEWAAEEHAAWTCTDGRWHCEGQASPGGVSGTVEVETL